MSAPAAAALLPDAAPEPPGGTAGNRRRGGVRGAVHGRMRRWGFWALLLLLLAGMAALQLTRSPGESRDLSPGNAAPNGARAVAEVLRSQGVQVLVPGSLADARSMLESAEPAATLLLHDADGYLRADQLESLDGEAGRLVLVEPSLPQLRALAPGVLPAGLVPSEGGPLPADCTLPGPVAAGTLSRGGMAYRAPSLCFTFQTRAGSAGAYATADGGSTVVLGAGHALSNERITEAGNAALALHTLGSTGTLVWYQPTAADIAPAAEPQDPLSLLPAWVTPVSLWLMAVGVLAMLWRGRRLGPLVAEPLPVVVPAAETAEGRARLYQQSRAVARAAANLRAGTLTRLAAHLRLGPGTGAAAVVHAAAAALQAAAPDGPPSAAGYDPVRIEQLLRTYTPGTEAELASWAQDLLALEKEVIH
ncbi:DUF4350 domain-containing protein [Arthrobacter deserti]|uniref:DUF4350 domain-containing protein n=1 Tax=Arthrobacter deserti TaxID=1742687 RepID=A0ABX1JS69_9MICC|nr:DUF4350 domain-containing protein [Arthrobacter deserti]